MGVWNSGSTGAEGLLCIEAHAHCDPKASWTQRGPEFSDDWSCDLYVIEGTDNRPMFVAGKARTGTSLYWTDALSGREERRARHGLGGGDDELVSFGGMRVPRFLI